MHVKKGSDVKLVDDGTLDYWRGLGYEPFETGDLVIAPAFAPNTQYTAGQLVWQAGALYRAKVDFTAGESFSTSDWDAVGGSAASSALSAFYGDESMGAGNNPTLVLEASRWTADADGVACEVDATVHNQVNILQDGVYALTAQGFMYNTGTTGGSVTLRINRGEANLQFDNDMGGNPGESGEVDATVSVTLALLADDNVQVSQSPAGADNTGNILQLLVCKIS